jgi:hypothetical protein
MNEEMTMRAENWLMEALWDEAFDLDQFKAVTQFHAALSKKAKASVRKSFSPEQCRKGVRVLFGKEVQ